MKHFCEGWGIISRVFLLYCYTNCSASSSFSCLRNISHLLQKWEYKYYSQTPLKINRNGYSEFCPLFKIIPSNTILRWLNFVLWDIWLQYLWWNVIKVKYESKRLQFWCFKKLYKNNFRRWFIVFLPLSFSFGSQGNHPHGDSTETDITLWNVYFFSKAPYCTKTKEH